MNNTKDIIKERAEAKFFEDKEKEALKKRIATLEEQAETLEKDNQIYRRRLVMLMKGDFDLKGAAMRSLDSASRVLVEIEKFQMYMELSEEEE